MLVRQLRRLSVCDFSAGVLASAARLLSYYIHCGALLGSVAKLDRVPVSLTSHARSWIPGSQFGVVAGPEPQLVKVGGGTLTGPEYDTRLLVARGQLQSDWVTGTLAPDWKVQGVEEADLPAESPRWWGTGKLIEFAAHIPDLSVLYQLVASVRREWCHWCGMELIGDRCGFCGRRSPRTRATPFLPASRPGMTARAVRPCAARLRAVRSCAARLRTVRPRTVRLRTVRPVPSAADSASRPVRSPHVP